MKKQLFIGALLILINIGSVKAQKEVIDFLNAGVADANTLAHAYLKPYGEMLGTNLNSGWYNSAKVHKIGGVDFTLSVSYTMVPNSGKKYDINPLESQLTNVKLSDPNNSVAPTVAGEFGPNETLPELQMKDDPTGLTRFSVPNGSGFDAMPTPMIQGAVGLPFHTEVMGRFMPKVEYKDYGKAFLWGIGVKHSLKDYIPFVKRVPFLQLSVLGAYTKFESSLGVEYGAPEEIGLNEGKLEINSNAYTGRLLVGANFPVIALYTGMGYGNTKSGFGVKGTFVTTVDGEVTDPIDLNYTTSGFDFNVGMRLRLAVFSIHADYSVGDYSMITAGVGINFR
ncbi:hypothetical protein DMA11_05120 [Marinilabiliaceae bacterium JC017]|nr:hypothetical protein DMA11_05120 [Marinilabiliaceae bacterium JC017]